MKLIYIHRKEIYKRPPVISTIKYLTELGYTPHVITTAINDIFKNAFAEKALPYTVIPFKMGTSIVMNFIKGVLWGLKTKREVRTIAKKEKVILWIEGNYTFTSLTPKFINKYPHILQVQEMPDTQSRKGQYQLKTLGKIMSTALANFSPEYNRANIYRALLGLKDTPYVLPNKPAFLPTKDSLMEMGIRYKDIVNKINGRRVILYQGLLGKERNIGSFIKVIRKLDKEKYVTVLLGKKTPMLDIYKYHDPNLIHIDYLPAPDYLFITSLAYLGIVSYLPDKLNTIFCAPNKIFEYSAFGIPMLGNNIPGLKYTIEESGCGLVCDDSSEEDIFEKLNVILNNYQKYSENAIRFFNSVDNKETIRKALLKIENKGFDR